MNKDYQRFLDWAISKGAIDKLGRLNFRTTKVPLRHIHKYLKIITMFLPEDTKYITRFRIVKANLDQDNCFCPACGNLRNYETSSCKFRTTCGIKDKHHLDIKNSIMIGRFKKTNLERYGFENPNQDPKIQSKTKQTNLERYGVENPMQNPDIQRKFEKTMQERFGVNHPSKSKSLQAKKNKTYFNNFGVTSFGQIPSVDIIAVKIQQTIQSKYGVSHPMKNQYVMNKYKDTNLKRYGVENPMQSQIIFQRFQKRSIIKYGVSMPFNSNSSILSREKTWFENYGVNNPNQHHLNLHNLSMLSKEFIEENFIENGLFLIKDFQEFIGCCQATAHKYLKNFNVKYSRGLHKGFNFQEKAILYFIKDIPTCLYKIGITNKNLNDRFGKLFIEDRILILSIENFEIGQDAFDKEQQLLREYSELRTINNEWPDDKGGKTEFFTEDILQLNTKETI